jgi:hypothetical protein
LENHHCSESCSLTKSKSAANKTQTSTLLDTLGKSFKAPLHSRDEEDPGKNGLNCHMDPTFTKLHKAAQLICHMNKKLHFTKHHHHTVVSLRGQGVKIEAN